LTTPLELKKNHKLIQIARTKGNEELNHVMRHLNGRFGLMYGEKFLGKKKSNVKSVTERAEETKK